MAAPAASEMVLTDMGDLRPRWAPTWELAKVRATPAKVSGDANKFVRHRATDRSVPNE
jgi:hypothetical protein